MVATEGRRYSLASHQALDPLLGYEQPADTILAMHRPLSEPEPTRITARHRQDHRIRLMTPMRPCIEPDCPNLCVARRCPSCARAYRRRRKAEGRTGQRGSTTAWRRLRAKVIANYGYRCAVCDSDERLEVDHVDGDPTNDSMLNLQALCQSCHKHKHREQQDATRSLRANT